MRAILLSRIGLGPKLVCRLGRLSVAHLLKAWAALSDRALWLADTHGQHEASQDRHVPAWPHNACQLASLMSCSQLWQDGSQ